MNVLAEFADYLTKTQNVAFEQKRDSLDTIYTKTLKKGDTSEADYRSIDGAGLGAAVYTTEGGTYFKDEYKPGTTRITTFNTFTMSVVTPWQLVEDMYNNGRIKKDKLKFFTKMNDDFLNAHNWTREVIAADFILSATSTTATRTWPGTFRDGLALASASHTLLADGATFTNSPTASALSALTLKEAIKMLSDIPTERGQQQATVKRVQLECSRYYMYRVPEILQSKMQPDTLNNNINSLTATGLPDISVVYNPYLGASSKAWAVRDVDNNQCLYFDKTPVRQSKDRDPYNNNWIHKSESRFAIDCDSVKCIVVNAGA